MPLFRSHGLSSLEAGLEIEGGGCARTRHQPDAAGHVHGVAHLDALRVRPHGRRCLVRADHLAATAPAAEEESSRADGSSSRVYNALSGGAVEGDDSWLVSAAVYIHPPCATRLQRRRPAFGEHSEASLGGTDAGMRTAQRHAPAPRGRWPARDAPAACLGTPPAPARPAGFSPPLAGPRSSHEQLYIEDIRLSNRAASSHVEAEPRPSSLFPRRGGDRAAFDRLVRAASWCGAKFVHACSSLRCLQWIAPARCSGRFPCSASNHRPSWRGLYVHKSRVCMHGCCPRHRNSIAHVA